MSSSQIVAPPEASASKEPMVLAERVKYSRGALPVLTGVDLTIERGEWIGLIGPNGGGKTTLARLIVGLLTPDEGTLEVCGSDPAKRGGQGRRIGYLPQTWRFDERFPATVEDVVVMGAYGDVGLFRRVPGEAKEKAREMLEMVGGIGYADRPIGKLSGGQQQRVSIARALMSSPELLVLDEPLAGLDIFGQQRFFELITELKSRFDLTVLMISHDIGQIVRYTDRIACLNQHIHWHDKPQNVTGEMLGDAYECEWHAFFDESKSEGF